MNFKSIPIPRSAVSRYIRGGIQRTRFKTERDFAERLGESMGIRVTRTDLAAAAKKGITGEAAMRTFLTDRNAARQKQKEVMDAYGEQMTALRDQYGGNVPPAVMSKVSQQYFQQLESLKEGKEPEPFVLTDKQRMDAWRDEQRRRDEHNTPYPVSASGMVPAAQDYERHPSEVSDGGFGLDAGRRPVDPTVGTGRDMGGRRHTPLPPPPVTAREGGRKGIMLDPAPDLYGGVDYGREARTAGGIADQRRGAVDRGEVRHETDLDAPAARQQALADIQSENQARATEEEFSAYAARGTGSMKMTAAEMQEKIKKYDPDMTNEEFLSLPPDSKNAILRGMRPPPTQEENEEWQRKQSLAAEAKAKTDADALQSKRDASYGEFGEKSGRFGDIAAKSEQQLQAAMQRLRSPGMTPAEREQARHDVEVRKVALTQDKANVLKTQAESQQIYAGMKVDLSTEQRAVAKAKLEHRYKLWDMEVKSREMVMDHWEIVSGLHKDRADITKIHADIAWKNRGQPNKQALEAAKFKSDTVFAAMEAYGNELKALNENDILDEDARQAELLKITKRHADTASAYKSMMKRLAPAVRPPTKKK